MDRKDITDRLAQHGYIAGPDLEMALWLMDLLGRPLLLEGEAGVGKTETAKALAAVYATKLIRLQCYEGLDASAALYEWNYQRQLLSIKARETSGQDPKEIERSIFSEDYLLERPLLAAIRQETPPVLLIDEVDRADEEFEALLLEVLADFQVSIPEFGTVTARSIPRVVLTSNGTRELSDALRRRCLYHYVDYPGLDQETRILLARVPGISSTLADQIARFVALVRKEDLRKAPGVAESIDWAASLVGLGVARIEAASETVLESLMCLVKTREDQGSFSREVAERLIGKVA
ncbi:MAG TPA: MoxR family ATPase [Alphaproteobacteria bacterium]|nr:MoxR family ATPase [Alphaproteobacteria bacterium]